MTHGPIIIHQHDDTTAQPTPADVVPITDGPVADDRTREANHRAALSSVAGASTLSRLFAALLLSVLTGLFAQFLWSSVSSMIATSPLLGYIFSGFVGALGVVAIIFVLGQGAAYLRLRKMEDLQQSAITVRAHDDLSQARSYLSTLLAFYQGREDTSWASQTLMERQGEVLDAQSLMDLAERELIAPLDARALREIEATARKVASVTALLPLALIDVSVTMLANVRMIQRIAKIYGGRSGFIGNWRLTSNVFAHMFATGAISLSDDLISASAGRTVLGTVSRRLGEGFVNGALSVRIGIIAMDVCRPMPFVGAPRPKVSKVITNSLKGFFGK